MTAQEIITLFELQVDDTTELSTTEELALLNRVYQKLLSNRPWEFMKSSASGTLSTTLPYVTLPTDFAFFCENNQATDNSIAVENNASPKVVFVGNDYNPYQIVNWSDRRQYRNSKGYAYADIPNGLLYFTMQPDSADSYEFDYIKNVDDLIISTSPIFPTRFHPILAFLMAVDDYVIQQTDKNKTYAPENQAKADSYFRDLAYYNSQLILN